MCGIAGFSLSPNSTIKVRQLSNALLTAIEDRGYMASGYAWQKADSMGVYKAAVTGSSLPLKSMPKKARNVILHTRLATHGSVDDNRNNHPVMSPSNDIALVHNGVIYNHQEVRRKVDGKLPDVDTSVIPALLEQKGIESIDLLDGDAAIAWFDRKESNTLHLARYQHSPLVMCQVEDGSFIFASTEALLWRALIQLDLMPTWMETAKELEYYTIRDGIVASKSMLPEPKYDSTYDYAYYRHQTAGAKGSSTPKVIGGSWYDQAYVADSYYYDDEWDSYWDTPMALRSTTNREYGSEDVVDADVVDDEYYGDVLFDDLVPIDLAKWYTKIQDDFSPQAQVLLYLPSEENAWKDELYLLAQDTNITLLDYGTLNDKLEFVPMTEAIF